MTIPAFEGNTQAETTIQFERSMAAALIFYIIMSKFGHEKEIGQIVLLISDKCSKIGFQFVGGKC